MSKTLIILFILFSSCKSNTIKKVIIATDSSVNTQRVTDTRVSDSFDYQLKPFAQLKNYPLIKDTAIFIRELKDNCHVGGIYF